MGPPHPQVCQSSAWGALYLGATLSLAQVLQPLGCKKQGQGPDVPLPSLTYEEGLLNQEKEPLSEGLVGGTFCIIWFNLLLQRGKLRPRKRQRLSLVAKRWAQSQDWNFSPT